MLSIVGALFLLVTQTSSAPLEINFLVLTEVNSSALANLLTRPLKDLEEHFKQSEIKLNVAIMAIDREYEAEEYQTKVCSNVTAGVSAILDLTWTGWNMVRNMSKVNGIPYVRLDVTIGNFMFAAERYLNQREATDAALIFHSEEELDQALYFLIGNSIIRVIAINGLHEDNIKRLQKMRPTPSYYVLFAKTKKMNEMFYQALIGKLVTHQERWTLVFTDFEYQQFDTKMVNLSVVLMTMKSDFCCYLKEITSSCSCNNFEIVPNFLQIALKSIITTLLDAQKIGLSISLKSRKCDAVEGDVDTKLSEEFSKNLPKNVESFGALLYVPSTLSIHFKSDMDITLVNSTIPKMLLAEWKSNKLLLPQNITIKPSKRFFRVGTAEGIPWSYKKRDENGKEIIDDEGKPIWEGYCIDLLKKLASYQFMNFDYEIVAPEDNEFGKRHPNGTWTGMVGDLAKGETDMIIAPLTMTSEREEVIDFVAPYFDQSGISIVIRKPVRETSLFKFMTVLRLEVWLSIVGALTVTGFMIWLLDKYSPYSAQNNKAMYPYPCREFTLKESFWFALTSFTPQGGGEAPKALSGRTLVAAYWLFVVLMLATFTANLAAFLTVERMKSPVQSLEQLARQSRINYTVVKNSETHAYFKNMQNAEDVLYGVWKDITLNNSNDQSKYRVWDYPIKEQYGHILQAIELAGPVENAEEGFQKVIDQIEGKFAFIHDAAEIRYQVSRNCNLTEVGETFAEQPYAIAVQQGSHLQEEISRKILDLQKDRYFETLTAKFWNSSAKGTCPNADDSEGITLESLGGVFIATLFGLALAMITLAGEIFYYKRKRMGSVNVQGGTRDDIPRKQVTIGREFKPSVDKGMPRVSYISVFPKNQLY